jgi:energy-coupling factor transport system ATP-binding protein
MEVVFNNVSYVYNINTPIAKTVLNDISLTLESNKIHGIIGPSGSGKTTLVELINALMYPNDGQVTVGKFSLKKGMRKDQITKLRFDVGLVFQFPEEQFFNATVKNEIAFALKHFKYKVNDIDKRVTEALKIVGLDETYIDRNPFFLSSGEKRKVAIASVLIFNPKIIVLDEPTVGLDYHGKKKLIKLIRKLKNNYNKTIIICTHDVDILYQIVDNVIVLKEGNVVLKGDKHEVLSNVALLSEHNIKGPKIAEFIYKVNQMTGIKMANFTDTKDLIKDIYRHV